MPAPSPAIATTAPARRISAAWWAWRTDAVSRSPHRFDALQGPFGKVWALTAFDGDCLAQMVSLGRYDATVGARDDGSCLCHLDHDMREAHATLGFYQQLPAHEALRAIAAEVLQ